MKRKEGQRVKVMSVQLPQLCQTRKNRCFSWVRFLIQNSPPNYSLVPRNPQEGVKVELSRVVTERVVTAAVVRTQSPQFKHDLIDIQHLHYFSHYLGGHCCLWVPSQSFSKLQS